MRREVHFVNNIAEVSLLLAGQETLLNQQITHLTRLVRRQIKLLRQLSERQPVPHHLPHGRGYRIRQLEDVHRRDTLDRRQFGQLALQVCECYHRPSTFMAARQRRHLPAHPAWRAVVRVRIARVFRLQVLEEIRLDDLIDLLLPLHLVDLDA